jgi:hypothetical protein
MPLLDAIKNVFRKVGLLITFILSLQVKKECTIFTGSLRSINSI